ncbi:alpha-L-fucosidase [Pseudactinotalea suaedae]|uniref:alpha-L-fucosidase n=1 Tax=Pseudactinotalea suaedae TaxID=1524924 RepID=UPI0012E2292D|nr:alpha-L-fucosidase [Pseudactinotalea suaedae]
MSTNDHTAWFTHDRFGMFIHWGMFAAGARELFIMSTEKYTNEEYERYMPYFDPDLYDPAEWARLAKQAGMKYAVLITKHHDGFCMWDTQESEFKITNTPYGRDITQEFVDAFRAEGIRVGFYYSIIDWHHPDFTIDHRHPLRDLDNADELNNGRDMERYREYMRAQVRELLTDYGPIDYLFYDYSYPERSYRNFPGKGRDDWGAEELMQLTRELQPQIIINDRLDIPGDLVTPEQYQPSGAMTRDGEPVVWEACQTLNGSWGYDRDNRDWKSPDLLVKMLIDGVAKDGNLILNVGPTARGEIEPYAVAALTEVGAWMRRHGRAIYGAGPAAIEPPADGRFTQRGDRLYLHLYSWPYKHIYLPDLAGKVTYAQLLHDASEIPLSEAPTQGWGTLKPSPPSRNPIAISGTLALTLPTVRPDVLVPVIELFLAP